MAWEKVIEILQLPPYLCKADPTKAYHVFTDASLYGAGWALTQLLERKTTQGKTKTTYHVIRCGSKLFPKRVKPKSALQRELDAIKFAVKDLRYWIQGRRTFLWTNHKPLTASLKTDPDACHNSEMIEFTLDYGLEIRYVTGKQNVIADCLSRLIIEIPEDLE